MKRRHVLAGLLLAFGCAPSGRRLEVDDLDDGESAPEPSATVEPLPPFAATGTESADGLARRPLLIFVIPADEGDRWRRGRVFGELLNHGDDASLAPLALFEVSCATMASLKTQFPGIASGREPWLVVVDRTRLEARAQVLADRELDELANREDIGEEDIDARMARLAWLFKSAAEPKMVERLAALEASTHSDALKDELIITTRDWSQARISVATAAAATLYAWAFLPSSEEDREWSHPQIVGVANQSLAAVVRDRLVRSQPPKGSRWAQSGGCGVRVEGARSHAMVGCGMGHVPERSRRFLSFYANAAEDPAA